MGEKLSIDQGKLLLGSGPESILVLFNLLSLKTQYDAGDANAKKLVSYVQKVSFDVFFGGATTTRPLKEVLLGFAESGLSEKRTAGELVGGAAWLPEKVELIPTSRRPSAFSKINTGIYDRNHLRKIMEVEQSASLGSILTIFKGEYDDVTEFLDSNRPVYGNSLLGFHSDLSISESLPVLLDFAYQGVTLVPAPSADTFNGVDAIQYKVTGTSKAFIGFNEQNQRSISIVTHIPLRVPIRTSKWTPSPATLSNFQSNSLFLRPPPS
jgi:hypothetical protein